MTNLDPPDIETLSLLLRQVAREELMPRFGQLPASEKADGSLVTEADLAVQRRLVSLLATHWPDIPLLGEEMSAAEQQRLLSDQGAGLWCLDPIDGTSNFACGFPGFCISLALLRAGQVELGLVLDPVRDECFSAVRGQGATMNGQPIRPYSPGQQLSDCLAMVDFKRLPKDRVAGLFGADSFRSQRNLGAVALEWCWLGAGRFQLYLHGGQGLWDHAAGRLIATEAGAATRLYAPGSAQPESAITLAKRVALGAANETLLNQWQTRIRLPLSAR
ncbi:inositol monophosphatase family protein [Lamprobacter modestohalophilus]|uniref:inositol monophosphatase family protein n=1 Tax=Lamprobacter modestohalophilus TaxID=1064514 RepID=UPI002ADEE874|nr:inositol monophosphatase family protein [Lamprobacter modestohalophilus]MEA1048466.1 inositol monophosphatase family protein [Lamprobacter modestohalophilus]